MQYANVGQSNLKFSKIILGTWQAGKDMWTGIDDAESIAAIQRAVEIGMTTIDTAIVYGSGHSEQIISKALRQVNRDKYQLATKVFSDHLKFDQVIDQCHQSLRNLQTDYIDLYQIHWPSGAFNSPIVPIEETMRALMQLKAEGKIKHIGVSNFSERQIEEALQFGEVVSNQPPYSLIWRSYDKETNPFCRKNKIAILAYSPLAQGILTGKFAKGHRFKEGDNRIHNKLMKPEVFDKIEIVLLGLKKYADKYHATLGNVALNWLISQPETFAIVGARNVQQIEVNAKACDFALNAAEIAELDRLSENVTKSMVQTEMMWEW